MKNRCFVAGWWRDFYSFQNFLSPFEILEFFLLSLERFTELLGILR